jgi:hypothetical protein
LSVRYSTNDDLVHAGDADPTFQDSHYLMWYDAEHGIGGMHRLAVHPPRGTSNFMCGIVTHDGRRYRGSQWEIPWVPQDGAYAVNDSHRLNLEDDHLRLVVAEPDCEVDLRWIPSGPMFHILPTSAMASSHFEGAGRVRGEVRLGEHRYTVDAMAFRDRSWGPRSYSAVSAHRWFAGTTGTDLTFSASAILLDGGGLACEGIVIENGKQHRTSDVDLVIQFEADGFTHRGGELVMTFDDRPDFRVTAHAVDGVAFPVAGKFFTVDTICVADIDGRPGFCNVEASNNVRTVGTQPPEVALRAAVTEGLSQR